MCLHPPAHGGIRQASKARLHIVLHMVRLELKEGVYTLESEGLRYTYDLCLRSLGHYSGLGIAVESQKGTNAL